MSEMYNPIDRIINPTPFSSNELLIPGRLHIIRYTPNNTKVAPAKNVKMRFSPRYPNVINIAKTINMKRNIKPYRKANSCPLVNSNCDWAV